MSSSSRTSGAGAVKRLLKELDAWRAEKTDDGETAVGVERLGPIHESDLLTWEAVINGRDVGSGYDEGRWLLSIRLPATYPHAPPAIRFVTPIVHPNISLDTGEICLDLLKDAWTPAYSVLQTVRAIRDGLLRYPEVDSPLNIDAAALLRGGDVVGARRLVELWAGSLGRYEGA
ncbi:unnamed protein product [Discula destructiva]